MLRGLVSINLAMAFVLGVVLLAGAAPTGPLAEVIEGAKKEGTVSVSLVVGFSEKSMYRLEKEIRTRAARHLVRVVSTAAWRALRSTATAAH